MKKEYEEYLKENYGKIDITLEEMGNYLGLTTKTTAAYAQRMGLKRNTIFPKRADEIFKSLKFLGLSKYKISNYGTIIDDNEVLIRSQPHHQSEYLQTRLTADDGNRKSVLVHKLVAETFLEKPNINNIQIDHINGNRKDNSVNNLQYLTPSENVSKTKSRTKVIRYLTEQEVRDICIKLEEGLSISQICKTNEFYTKSKVEKIKQRARWIEISKEYKF